VLRRNGNAFVVVLHSTTGAAGFDLGSVHDRAFAFDYASTRKLDHIALYRAGGGKMFIVKADNAGTGFTTSYQSIGPATGVGDHALDSTDDRVVGYDFQGTRKLDHLLVYRPGAGNAWVLQRDAGGGYTAVHKDNPAGHGIGGYALDDTADRIVAYDHMSAGRRDHLLCYRPGRGAAAAVRRLHERLDVWTLLANDPWDPITLWYAKAAQVMQARAANDPTGWLYQANMHGLPRGVAAGGALVDQCQHGSWFFLPWHRMYVYYFERIVRAAVIGLGGPADFALPYWDYENITGRPANTLPKPFRTQLLPDASPNPLYITSPGREASYMGGAALAGHITRSTGAMPLTQFSHAPTSPVGSSFGGGQMGPRHFTSGRGSLEGTPHGAIHNAIGGTGESDCSLGQMSSARCAARDPIFWLHHTNIDRLWEVWLAQGGGRANPTQNAWLNQLFTFHDETAAQVTMTCAQVVNTAVQLDYVYR
jgi:hypothetical protein